jgi:hypothetical protein
MIMGCLSVAFDGGGDDGRGRAVMQFIMSGALSGCG